MRDRERIDRMVILLRTYWMAHQDWRLGQAIVNLTGRNDPFDVEDDEMENLLRTWAGPCIETTWKRIRNGYGWRWQGNAKQLAHRVAWEETFGPIPEGMLVLHRCDNPPCVNPAHLFLGTPADNVQDMWQKGRAPRHKQQGEKHPGAKLTEDQVREIRRLVADGMSRRAAARRFGVYPTTVDRIIAGLGWKNVV